MNWSEAIETAKGAYDRFFHRAKATVLIRELKLMRQLRGESNVYSQKAFTSFARELVSNRNTFTKLRAYETKIISATSELSRADGVRIFDGIDGFFGRLCEPHAVSDHARGLHYFWHD
jgi:hypothetical protein